MTIRAGSGAEALFAISIDKPSSVYAVGHPYMQTKTITPPSTAPTVVANVSTGPVPAGTYQHAYSWIGENDLETTLSAWSADTVTATTTLKLELSALDAVTDARVIGVRIWRRHLLSDGVTYSDEYLVGRIFDTSLVAYDDALSHLSDPPVINFRKRAATVNQTGANYEWAFFNPQSADMSVSPGKIDTKQLGGGAGESRALAGPLKFAHTWKNVVNDGEMVRILTAKYGLPDVYWVVSGAFAQTGAPTEPTRKYVWHPKNRWEKSRSVSLLKSDGGSLKPPVYFWQSMVDDLALTTGTGAAVEMTAKFMGCNYTPHGIGVPGTHVGAGLPPVLFGKRGDSQSLTAALVAKVQTVLTASVLKWRTKRVGGAYGSTAVSDILMTADSGNNQTRSTSTLGDAVALIDDAVPPQTLGTNKGSNRRQLGMMAPSTLVSGNYPASDDYTFGVVAKIPGRYSDANPTGPADDGTYSGVDPVFFDNPAWTDTSCVLKVGSAAADTLVEVMKSNVGLKSALKEIRPHGPQAATPIDLDPTGDTTCTIQFDRRLYDRYYQALQEADGRIYADWRLTGEPIEITPGVLSEFCRQLRIYGSQGRIDDTKEPISKKDTTDQTVSIVFEQLDGNRAADPFTIELITDKHVAFPSATD